MTDDHNKRVHQRMQEELAEANDVRARYQKQLDMHWQAQRDAEADDDDYYECGGFTEYHSKTRHSTSHGAIPTGASSEQQILAKAD